MSNNTEIIGNLLGETSPTEVFVRIDPRIVRSDPLKLGEYLVIEYQNEDLTEPVLASVVAIGLENLNFPDSILTSPAEFRSLFRFGDLTDGEVLTAKAQILGFLNPMGELEIPRFSPPPGATVIRAPVELLSKAFGKGHVRIGSLLTNKEVEVQIDVNEFVRRHSAILAITGGGKGNTVAVVVSRILKLGGTVVIVDPHNEYLSMRKELGDKLVAFSVEGDIPKGVYPLKFRYRSFSAADYLTILGIPENASKQRGLFREACRLLADTNWDYKDLIKALKQADSNRQGTGKPESDQFHAIHDRIAGAKEFILFDKSEEVPLVGSDTSPGIINKGCMTVLSLAGLDNDIQQALVRHVAKRILRGGVAWRHKEEGVDQIPCPVLLVIEESHNFIPAQVRASSKAILRTIASEGRKFGVGLCVVSQRPGKIDSDVLSQCNSMIVLRIVNPRDQSNIETSAEALSKELMKELPSLNVGEAVIFGPAINLPAVIKIDKYEGKLGGEDIDIVGDWSKKEKKKKKRTINHSDDDELERRSWN